MCTVVKHVYKCGHSKDEKAPCAISKATDCKTLIKRQVVHDQTCFSCGGS